MKLFIYISFLFIVMRVSSQTAPAIETIRYNLSGTDKDHTVDWDFFCTKGRNSGKWTKIAVPSNWEQQGFGGYNYGHDKIKNDEEGMYKYVFKANASWINKKIYIVFEGSMTDTEVKLNGQLAGDIHQGAFYRFKYDVTQLMKIGADNLLEVKVSKMSSNASVNRAERQSDFWVFGGIFRPVYLEIVPDNFIDRVAIDAKADGALTVDAYVGGIINSGSITAQVQLLNGTKIGQSFSGKIGTSNKVTITQKVQGIKAWNPEFPSLYELVIGLTDAKGIRRHVIKQRFGFRTVEVRKQDGIYINQKKILLKGVNHHSEWPETGRTLSREIDLMDIGLMKEMNMNAVRMSHYPPDQSFLDVCDSLGLFVLDELTGWQAKYDTVVGRKLVKELVVRDVNHPSIILWDNGNEGGWNRALDGDFDLYDPQKRTVIHPWERFNYIDTKHYPIYNYVVNSSLYDEDIFLPTEFMHGLYDGGHGAGLDDFWNLILQHPHGAGGFLWAFHDEAVARTDKNGQLDTDGNHAPDGIVGPHREKEGSFYTIKEIWSPVYMDLRQLKADFNGQIPVENRFLFTNLDQCSFSWQLVSFSSPNNHTILPTISARGVLKAASIAPGSHGQLSIPLPKNWQESDALDFKATDPHGKEIFTWTIPIQTAATITGKRILRTGGNEISIQNNDDGLIITSGNVNYYFDKKGGGLMKVIRSGANISLHNGPLQTGASNVLERFEHGFSGKDYVVKSIYRKDSFHVKWTFSPGMPAKLEYSYQQKEDADFMGITFDYPEEKITGMKWLGKGPYRVWKNRLKGGRLGVWHKDYNNTITGESWNYPEFKGYHANLFWVVIENKESPFTIYTETQNIFLQMLKPQRPAGASNENTTPAFPEGAIGFMHAISPIGTKFKPALDMGPQSQKNMMLKYTPISGTLWLDFR